VTAALIEHSEVVVVEGFGAVVGFVVEDSIVVDFVAVVVIVFVSLSAVVVAV
jgi:hypothetical protein